MIDRKRIYIYLAFAFGIAWASALVIYLTGGIAHSPELVPGSKITLALVLLASVYMTAPALGHLFTRLITREGWQNTWLRPHFKRGWRYWVAGWFMPAVFTILGAAFFFLLFPQFFDAGLKTISEMLKTNGMTAINPWLAISLNVLSGVLIAPVLNGIATFGEEFGWRAYLQPKLMPLGARKAMLWMGLIWGIWHWPVIAMGHNYGLDYPGAPWLGLLAMVLFTFICGTLLGWIVLRGGSVWPAVIGHAAINGIASLPALFIQGRPNPLLGPLPVGIIPLLIWALPVIYLFLNPHLFSPKAADGSG